MNLLNSILIILASLIGVYMECTFNGFRHLFGAQLDVLPPLMVYAALRTNPAIMAILAVTGGLCFDSLSANLLGVSTLPLYLVSLAVYSRRGLILQEQFYARFVLGAAASAIVPVLSLLLLLSTRQSPIIGWGSLWQWVVMGVGGGLMTVACFWIFDWLNGALNYHPVAQSSFRQDREIARGRN